MLSILGIVAIIVISRQVYKSAGGTGRSAGGWTVLSVVIGIGIQFLIPMAIGLGYGIYLAITEGPGMEVGTGFFGLMTVISVAAIILSIGGMWLVANHVSKVPDEEANFDPPPPPPPTFNHDA